MRDWLWKYQRPTVIWWQVWLKRQLKQGGHFPHPLSGQFVRDFTEMLLKDAVEWPGKIYWKRFTSRMRASPAVIDRVIGEQAELAKSERMTPPEFLVMKHLGYFKGKTQQY